MPVNFNIFCDSDCVLSKTKCICSPFSCEKFTRDSDGVIPLTVTVRVAGYLQMYHKIVLNSSKILLLFYASVFAPFSPAQPFPAYLLGSIQAKLVVNIQRTFSKQISSLVSEQLQAATFINVKSIGAITESQKSPTYIVPLIRYT